MPALDPTLARVVLLIMLLFLVLTSSWFCPSRPYDPERDNEEDGW